VTPGLAGTGIDAIAGRIAPASATTAFGYTGGGRLLHGEAGRLGPHPQVRIIHALGGSAEAGG
jgi:hypothetical protein